MVPPALRPQAYYERFVYRKTGGKVAGGPFAGLRYPAKAIGSALLPKLIGLYEKELSPVIEQAIARPFDLVVDIGAAEGYYAVGMRRAGAARRMIAYEASDDTRSLLEETCRLNETSIDIRGWCSADDLNRDLSLGLGRAMVLCDCEGAEQELLDPAAVPALRGSWILVEVHDFIVPGIEQRLMERFAESHQITVFTQEPRSATDMPFRNWYTSLFPKMYVLWAVGEHRPVRMNWLWMEPKERP